MARPITRLRISSYSKAASPLEQSFYGRFVTELVRMRKARGWTQEHLNGTLGIADGLVAKWETFQSLPGAFMLMTWCMALDARLTATAIQLADEEADSRCPDLEAEDVPLRRAAP